MFNNYQPLTVNFEVMTALYEKRVATGVDDFAHIIQQCELSQAYNFWQFALENRTIVERGRILEDMVIDLEQRLAQDQSIDTDLKDIIQQCIIEANLLRAMAPIVFQYNQPQQNVELNPSSSPSMRMRASV